MSDTNWAELHVELQPLSYRLYQAMERREWAEAENLAGKMTEVSFQIQRECIKQMVHSGQGFAPQSYIYEGA